MAQMRITLDAELVLTNVASIHLTSKRLWRRGAGKKINRCFSTGEINPLLQKVVAYQCFEGFSPSNYPNVIQMCMHQHKQYI
jgi:hypothetical protein